MEKKKVFTINEASKLIEGVSAYRIRQMCKNGQLRHFKAGNKYLISESDLTEAVFGKN